ncbi:MAG: hypothetical protein AAF918_16955 [Pseudomonadota bacterium]
MLRGYGIESTSERKPVALQKVAEIVGIHQNSVSACNQFFIDVGLIEKQGHKFTPAREVVDFTNRMQWNADDAAEKLQPILKDSWFARVVLPRLQLRSLSEEDVIAALADASNASPTHKAQLTMLLDYLASAGLIKRDNGAVTIVQVSSVGHQSSSGGTGGDDPERQHRHEPPPPPPPREDEISFQIPIPGKDHATITVPKGLEVQDWDMLKVMIDAYIKRLRKEAFDDE